MDFGFVVDGCRGRGAATIQPTHRNDKDQQRFHCAPIVLQLSEGNVRVCSRWRRGGTLARGTLFRVLLANSLHRSAVAELESNIPSGNIVAPYDKHNLSAKLFGGFGVVRPPSCAAGSAAAGISWDAGSV